MSRHRILTEPFTESLSERSLIPHLRKGRERKGRERSGSGEARIHRRLGRRASAMDGRFAAPTGGGVR